MNLNQTEEKSLCTIDGIRLSAIMGGPLSAFYFISKNFAALGNKPAARKNLLYGVILTVAMCSLILLPTKISSKIPGFIVPVTYTFMISAYASRLQENAIKEGLVAGIKKYSILKIMGISILSLIITIGISFGIFLVAMLNTFRTIEYEIGLIYQQGKIVSQNDTETAKWFLKAAEKNDPDAQNDLGVLYHQGRGVPQNDIEAARWYRKSAEQGNMDAQNNLGYAYHVGQGVVQNDAEAAKWIYKSAKQGNAQAQLNLAQAYHSGNGVPQDDAQAMAWLKKSAAQGFPPANELLLQLNQTN